MRSFRLGPASRIGHGLLKFVVTPAFLSRYEDQTMPRKPNYNFERQERDRAKAIKVAEKAAAKAAQREADRAAGREPSEGE